MLKRVLTASHRCSSLRGCAIPHSTCLAATTTSARSFIQGSSAPNDDLDDISFLAGGNYGENSRQQQSGGTTNLPAAGRVGSASEVVEPIFSDSLGDIDTLQSSSTIGGSSASTFGNDDSAKDEEHASLLHAVDALLDDFVSCKPDILNSFARSKGAKNSANKVALIKDLVDVAYVDATQSSIHLRNARRLLGDEAVNELSGGTKANLRKAWSNQSLETAALESAAKKIIGGTGLQTKDMAIRSVSKTIPWIVQRLLRIYQDEFDSITSSATGGVSRPYSNGARKLFANSKNPIAILGAYVSCMANTAGNAFQPSMISQSSVADNLANLELVSPTTIGTGDIEHLERLMGLMDSIVEDMEAREKIYDETTARNVGLDTAETLVDGLNRFVFRHRDFEFTNVPDWVKVLATQFEAWELTVRNDIKQLGGAPKLFFDAILMNVVAMKLLKSLYGSQAKPTTEIPGAYRSAIKLILDQWLGEATADDVILRLFHHTAVPGTQKTTFSADLCLGILGRMQSALPDGSTRPSNDRIAIILKEAASTATRAESAAGTYELILRNAEDLRFHLRFSEAYDKMTTREKLLIRTAQSGKLNMPKTLSYFEEELGLQPLDCKTCVFISVIMHYMLTKSSGSAPVLQQFVSCTGAEELSIVKLGHKKNRKLSELKVALPPQLSHESWLDAKRNQGVYSVVGSNAIKGNANDLMLVSQAPMLKALDAISRIPWRINKYMLFVQESMLQEGYGFGKIRPGFYPLNYCSMPTGEVHSASLEATIFNQSLQGQYTAQKDKDWKDLKDTRSSRVHYIQALRQARALVNHDQVYFPNSMDFRGRMYPLPGRLNHTGSDPFRAMLENAIPKELGKDGLYWLKVHLANKMGQSKISFDERAQYVDDHLGDVIQSAEAPSSGDRWWQEGDEPMQALLACKELADALKYSQGPEKFPSRLPVAVDGSCNGLQHYAAIGRDLYGAKLVNLVPSERPADAYMGVLNEMMKIIEADAANDHQIALRCVGSGKGQDKDHMKRKTVKQSIMTQVYGVTGYGMSKQILKQLEAQNKAHGLWTTTDMNEMSNYIRDKVLESLDVSFARTQLCRQWLKNITRIIWECQPSDLRKPFTWTTPLGLIVRQPYNVKAETHMFTAQGYTKIDYGSVKAAGNKQLSALAPNLIHSLDATHLAMTALDLKQKEVSMMAVHDSYWTHACDLPILADSLRRQFVDLYSRYDPLWEIKEQWEELFFFDLRRHGVKLPDPPARGELDMQSVIKSQYFFS